MALPAEHRRESPPRASQIGALLLIGVLSPVAAALAQERVDPVPVAPDPIVEALSPFAGDPDSSRVASLLADLAEAGFPATAYDGVLVARLWRRAGEPELAIERLEAIPVDSDAADLAVYEAARTLFESGRDAAGARAYWSACGSSDPRVRAELAWDLLPVTVPDEREAWPDVAPGERTCEWLRGFWAERALRMVITPEERIALHYRRLAEAHGEFWVKGPRALHGMADSFGRPEGLAVDDRGLLLIRLGSPSHQQACPEEVILDAEPDRASELLNLIGICWVYWRPGGYRIFYLSTRDRFGRDWPYGDFRIQESLSQQAEPGTRLFQEYVMNADIPEATKRRLVRRGPVYRNAKLALGGVETEIDDRLLSDLDSAENLALGHEIRDATRRHTAEVLERIPDAPDVEATVALQFETLRFLNPGTELWQVWMLASVRAGDLTPSSDDESAATRDVGGRFTILSDGRGVEITEIPARSVPVVSASDDAGIGVRGAFTAPPGPLPLTMVIEDLNAPGTGAWVQDTINVPAVGGLPQLSDIAVAQSEGGSWTRDGQTFLQVTPAHVTNPDGSIHTYFEAYGVRPGTRYDVELRLTEADAAERIWRLEPDDLAFRLQFTSEMPGEIGRHHLRLDLSDTEPGEYVLAVRIQDEETEAYSLPSVTDVFVAER